MPIIHLHRFNTVHEMQQIQLLLLETFPKWYSFQISLDHNWSNTQMQDSELQWSNYGSIAVNASFHFLNFFLK